MKHTEIEKLKYDLDCENQIIGCCILHGSEMFVKAKAWITTKDIFYEEDNKTIWATMSEMYDNAIPIEDTLIKRKLAEKTPFSFGGDNWGYTLIKKVGVVSNHVYLQSWCMAIVKDYIERSSFEALNSLRGRNASEITESLNLSIKKALEFKNIEDWADMSQLALELSNRREKIEKGFVFGVKTGFAEFDNLTGGFESGFIVIGARPSMGKTAFAVSLAISMARLGSAVGFISLEMPNVQLAGRLASIVSGQEFWRVFRNTHISEQEKADVNKSITEMASLPIYTTDSSSINLSDIRWKAEKLVKTKGAKIIIIDYLQLVDTENVPKNQTREREVAKLSKGLKNLSHELDIPIIALAQLNRESESADKVSKVGKLSQLRESGSIEQDIDMGIIVDRPFKRGQLVDENGQTTENKAQIIIEKFRNGETRAIDLEFIPKTMQFIEIGLSSNQDFDTTIKPNYLNVPNIKPFGHIEDLEF